jgi:hypothetical protein
MAYIIDFSIASSEQIEAALSKQLENIRLVKSLTQTQLARAAGVATMIVS